MSDVVHVDQRFRVAFKRLGRTFEGVYWVEDGQVRLTSPYGDAAREKRWSTPSDVAIQMLRELVRRALDQPGRATQNLSARD